MSFFKWDTHFDIYLKEIYRPNKCETLMTTKYKIDRNTGIITKNIESFSSIKPKKSYLKELKLKYPDIALKMAESNCKPKIGITNIRIWSDIGITQEQAWDWAQNDKDKFDLESKKLKTANCEVLEKKF